jgi:Zn-dependent protease with chaperone function
VLPDLSFLLAVLLGLSLFGPGPYEPWLAFGGTAAITLVAVALVGLSVDRALRALDEGERPEAALARGAMLPVTPLLGYVLALGTFGLGSALYDLLPASLWLLRYVLLFLPALVGFSSVWAGRARIDAAIAAKAGRAPLHASAPAAIRAGLKRNSLALIPLGIVLGLVDGLSLAADLGVPGCALARAALEDVPHLRVAFELTLLALLAYVFPVVMSRVLGSEPFPAGPTRTRLERLAQAIGLKYRDMRLWKTGGRGINAMVVGLTPGTRRIFITDGLLAALPTPEVEAVFCHEAGHAKRHHLLWFLGITCVVALAFMVLDEPLSLIGLPEGLPRTLLHLGILWFVVLGTISRQFERESDVDGATWSARLDPDAPSLPLPGLAHPLPPGAARMVGALKRIEMLLGNVHSHRHGTPSDRAAYVAHHATNEPARAAFRRTVRGLRLGIVLLALLLLALAALRLPEDLELARASADLRAARAAHRRAFDASSSRPEEAAAAWNEARAAYERAAERYAPLARVRARIEAPLAWLGMGDTALRGAGDLATARRGLEQALKALDAAPLPDEGKRRIAFEALVDLGRVGLREGRPPEEAVALLERAERGIWAKQGADGAHARARLRLLEGTLELARGNRENGAALLRELVGRTGTEDEWVELRRDAAEELARAGLLPEEAPK